MAVCALRKDRANSKGEYGPPDETASSEPFLRWLDEADRSGWTNRLSPTQQRYVERVLERRPDRVSLFAVDDLLVALDKTYLLNLLYPE